MFVYFCCGVCAYYFVCMSDDESKLWIERSKFEDICNELDDCDDNRVYEIVSEIEDKYELFV